MPSEEHRARNVASVLESAHALSARQFHVHKLNNGTNLVEVRHEVGLLLLVEALDDVGDIGRAGRVEDELECRRREVLRGV